MLQCQTTKYGNSLTHSPTHTHTHTHTHSLTHALTHSFTHYKPEFYEEDWYAEIINTFQSLCSCAKQFLCHMIIGPKMLFEKLKTIFSAKNNNHNHVYCDVRIICFSSTVHTLLCFEFRLQDSNLLLCFQTSDHKLHHYSVTVQALIWALIWP